MHVADREVVEAALDAGVAADRKIGLIALEIECAAMNATDAQLDIAGRARRQAHREVTLAGFRTARPRIEHRVGRDLECEVVAVHDVDPGRQARAEWMS